MRTIKPITQEEVDWLKKEESRHFYFVAGGSFHVQTALLPERIIARISLNIFSGCWIAGGANSGNGFAKIKLLGKKWRSLHRVVYTLLIGPIPDDKVLDHSKKKGCISRACCNPWHMEPVSVKENTERGDAVMYAPNKKAPPQLSDEA